MSFAPLDLSRQHHILVVDDDERIRELLGAYLLNQNYYVTLADSSAQARVLMQQFRHDLMILDVMMPGEDGLAFLSGLRQSASADASIPALLLTARGQVEDRVKGLSSGADDYLSKPFDPQELLLRIQSILRRARADLSMYIHFGVWRFKHDTRQLFRGDQHIVLTAAEESLLSIFCQRPGQVISRDELAVLQGHEVLERSMDVQVNRLRRKIEDDIKRPRYLQTIRHKGYIFYPS